MTKLVSFQVAFETFIGYPSADEGKIIDGMLIKRFAVYEKTDEWFFVAYGHNVHSKM